MTNIKEHWDKVYNTKAEDEVSWFQPYPKTSFEFVQNFQLPKSANIIDIGGGDGHFVDALLDNGYENIWVLDISANAIDRAKKRLGAERAAKVHWIVTDVLDFKPTVMFDFWHDRAAFHFFTENDKVEKYVSLATKAIDTKGFLVLGTFSEEGPNKCSGLDIKQYSENSISTRFKMSFDRIKCIREDHITPSKNVQNFLFCSFQKK
jgi:cyclopropane fatty-acyl-phospholipid synthase-like methyltransferase